MTVTTLFHCSDLHFGHPAVPEQYEAIEAMIEARKFDVVAISGDVSQRARAGEFQRARAFIQRASRVSHTIIVPGNHDVAWWRSPMGLGDPASMLEKYRKYISEDIEPVLRVAGATFVGLNTSHGVLPETLTWNMRDISIIGHLGRAQIERARAEFASSRTDDARIIVMHHNPVKGELSQRHGLKHTQRILGAFAEMGVELVLCGHDHQEAIHYIEHTKRGTIISTAGTISNRSRGGRPSSVNSIRITPTEIGVSTMLWSDKDSAFVAGPVKRYSRKEGVGRLPDIGKGPDSGWTGDDRRASGSSEGGPGRDAIRGGAVRPRPFLAGQRPDGVAFPVSAIATPAVQRHPAAAVPTTPPSSHDSHGRRRAARTVAYTGTPAYRTMPAHQQSSDDGELPRR